ncbi:DUF6695 family protein [Mangrovimonas sp. TPBH4]|uniref:DUF6695 family protein n=1 Tax=Mangrovimonas sp. TPBH4 TaxID=1645914 RepID=UPI0006B57263|nr:DUF6695 family protein [Mangrovimonas sp. TPBH4]
MESTGIILTLAYPETIVMVAEEWYSPLLRFVGVGKKNYVRAGHAALVLIEMSTGILEYHDFGRYITPEPHGRVRGKETDFELDFPLKAKIVDGSVENLQELLEFLATHPKLTHGEGTMYASICNRVNYKKAREHITKMQNKHFMRYAAFLKNATNCARFVADALIESVVDASLKRKLEQSKMFTPSTIGNVVIANTGAKVYRVTVQGEVSVFASSVRRENRRLFLDKLNGHQPNFIGTLKPKFNDQKSGHAQWLPGIAAGAWFEIHELESVQVFRFRRISPHGNIDVDGVYQIDQIGFDINEKYQFVQYSNCRFFHIEQQEQIFRFEFVKHFS